jgi:hypothetical protein
LGAEPQSIEPLRGDPTKPAQPARPSLALFWLALVGLFNGLLWAALVPPWQAPDEPKHFEYIRLLAEGEGLIAFASEAEAADPELQRWILSSMDAHQFWWYGHAPGYDPANEDPRFADLWPDGSHTAFYRSSPAYYALAAALQPKDRMLGLYAARLLGVLLLIPTILLTGWAARELFPDDPLLRYGAPAFVALHPMQAFLSAGVNNDALVNLLAAFVAFLIARLFARGWQPARGLLLLVGALLAVLVKRTSFWLLPLLPLALLASLAARSRRPALALGGGLLALLALALAAGRWLIGGGWMALPEAWRFTLSRYLFNEPDQPQRILAYLQAEGVAGILWEYLRGMVDGFWGSFGWQLLRFPAPFYLVMGLLTLLAAVGLLRRLLWAEDAAFQRAALATYALGLLLAAGGAVAFFASYLGQPYAPPPQGRYLFSAMLPAAIVFTAGLGAWIRAPLRPRALLVFAASLGVYDLAALLGLILPYFYR